MRRWVVRALRVSLYVAGIVFLIASLLTHFVAVEAQVHIGRGPLHTLVKGGLWRVEITQVTPAPPPQPAYIKVLAIPGNERDVFDIPGLRAGSGVYVMVGVRSERYWTLRMPLWLLAAICLAWPVTSLLLARRRRKGRGFAVEAKAAGSTPLPPGEVAAQRSGADGEGGHHHATGSSS